MSYPNWNRQPPPDSVYPDAQPALDQPLYGADPFQAMSRFFRKYVTFSGRASRSEYWWARLGTFLIVAVPGLLELLIIEATLGNANDDGVIAMVPVTIVLVLLATAVPFLAVTVRRLHDADLSGLLALLYLVPYVGTAIMFFMALVGSKPAGARFDLHPPFGSHYWGPGLHGPGAYGSGAYGSGAYGLGAYGPGPSDPVAAQPYSQFSYFPPGSSAPVDQPPPDLDPQVSPWATPPAEEDRPPDSRPWE